MNRRLILPFLLLSTLHLPSNATEKSENSNDAKKGLYSKHRKEIAAAAPFLKKTDREWQELNMPALLKSLDRTKTTAGWVEFENLLQPISDIGVLKSRRQDLEFLIGNRKLAVELASLVSEFALHYEDLFAHFLDDQARVHFLQDQGMTKYIQGSSLYQLGMQAFTTGLIMMNIGFDFWQVRRNIGAVRDGAAGRLFRGFIGWQTIGSVVGTGYFASVTYLNIIETLRKLNEADAYVLKAGQALDVVSKAHVLVKRFPQLANTAFANAFNQFSDLKKHSVQFTRAYKAANDRVKREGSMAGPISKLFSLDDYDDLRHSAKDLVNALQAMALLDAQLSVVALFKEHQAADLPVTFASFDETHRIRFNFKALNNPIVWGSIANDFALGLDDLSQHAVLTGPHGCGKTTIMKSVAYGIILGQSITIVPAQEAVFTPVTDIKTYFNIGDNLTEGLSSFMAEHERAAELLEYGTSLSSNGRALFLIDEPYAKTIQTIGEPRVANFLHKLSTIPNLSVMLATHFELPSKLAEETNGLVRNFQPEVDNNLRPTYKIIDGSANWWFHDIDRRDQFIDQLIAAK